MSMSKQIIPVKTIDFHGSPLQAFEKQGKIMVVLRRMTDARGIDFNA